MLVLILFRFGFHSILLALLMISFFVIPLLLLSFWFPFLLFLSLVVQILFCPLTSFPLLRYHFFVYFFFLIFRIYFLVS
jgi:hypothetical protein